MRPVVLIVEDEPAIADTIQYALETEGCDPQVVNVGGDVLDILADRTIHLIILDVGLPDISGFDLCKKIRRRYQIPIIFLTARNEEIDRVVGLEIGGDDYVVKPFSPRELAARVKAVLRRMPASEPAAESPSVFQVDEAKRKICYLGQLLELSRYEFELMATFIRRPGVVFTREKLMELVWESPESSMDRTVDAHIKNIRMKLKAIHPDIDPIVTHRGTGYALKDDL